MATRKQLEGLGVPLPPDSAFKVDLSWSDFKVIGLSLLARIGIGSSLPAPTQAGQVLRSGSVSPFTPVWSTLPISEGGNGSADAGKMLVFGSAGGVIAAAFTQVGSGDNNFTGTIIASTVSAQGGFVTGDRFTIQDSASFGAVDEFTAAVYDNSNLPAAFRVKRIEAQSPNGTLYQLTPPNGGGAATWVAV